MDSGFLILSHTLRYPHKVSNLLLPQPHVCKENAIMELHNSAKKTNTHISQGGLGFRYYDRTTRGQQRTCCSNAKQSLLTSSS